MPKSNADKQRDFRARRKVQIECNKNCCDRIIKVANQIKEENPQLWGSTQLIVAYAETLKDNQK